VDFEIVPDAIITIADVTVREDDLLANVRQSLPRFEPVRTLRGSQAEKLMEASQTTLCKPVRKFDCVFGSPRSMLGSYRLQDGAGRDY